MKLHNTLIFNDTRQVDDTEVEIEIHSTTLSVLQVAVAGYILLGELRCCVAGICSQFEYNIN